MPGVSLEPRDPAEIERYVLHAVDLIAGHALYWDRVNWDEVRDQAARPPAVPGPTLAEAPAAPVNSGCSPPADSFAS